MKQLKFMLAAATAIGLATAAQADTSKLIDNENFENQDVGTLGRALTGWSYSDPANAEQDDDSRVELDGSNKALKVNTGTKPLLRHLNDDAGTAVDMTAEGFESLYIDTMVQFTVTPDGETPEASKDENGKYLDKLMIYLQEVPADGETPASTKLMVKAAKYTAGMPPTFVPTFEVDDFEIVNATVQPNTWYRLKVSSYVENGIALFTIKLDNTELIASEALYDAEKKVFPSMQGLYDKTTNPKAASLTYVGFAGEGMVDDLTVATITTATSVDFTLALGEGVSAVQWTINDTEKEGEDSFSAPAGTTLNVAIKSVTYAAGYAGTQDWTEWTYSAAASGSIKITAEKFADVAVDGTVTLTEGTVNAVTEGAFKVPEATEDNAEAVAEAKADLAKALTWASSKAGKSYQSAIAAIKGMTFDEDGDPSGTGDAKTNAEAYLLDCAANQTAIDKAMEDFVLTGFSIGADGAMTFGVGAASTGNGSAYANGKVEVRGKATLDASNWVKNCPDAAFFKAFLVK